MNIRKTALLFAFTCFITLLSVFKLFAQAPDSTDYLALGHRMLNQEKYPDAEEGGIHDNAYTNIMVSWLLNKVIHFYMNFDKKELENIKKKTGLNEQEVEQWKDIRNNLYLEINDQGIIAQFSGYFDLQELDWKRYKDKYKDIRRMDRILKAENDSPDNYKVAKQADTLMLFYTLSPKQVKKIVEQMGYSVGDPVKFLRKNFDYYIKRTSHGSTLSYVVHAAILKYVRDGEPDRSRWFEEALKSDISDTQGGTTKEGIHTGVMAGTIDIIIESFAGLELFDNYFEINPTFPKHWREVRFKIHHITRTFEFVFTHEQVKITSLNEFDGSFFINYNNKQKEIKPLESITIDLE